MQYIVPIPVTDASLLATNAPNDAGIVLWEVGQTIAVGDERRYEGGNGIHWIVVAIQAHTTSLSNAPTGINTDPFWQYKFDTNPWRMFDQSSTSRTLVADELDVTIAFTKAVNAIALTGLQGSSVYVEQRDINGNVIYTRTVSLVVTSTIYDAYTYFFEPLDRTGTLLLTDLVLAYLSTIRIVVTNNTGDAGCSNVIVGRLEQSGMTEYGMKIGIRDYSVKETDDFGNTILTRRTFKSTLTVTTLIRKELSSGLRKKFNELRATPVFYIADSADESTQIYGYYQDCYNLASYFSHYQMNFEIEELS